MATDLADTDQPDLRALADRPAPPLLETEDITDDDAMRAALELHIEASRRYALEEVRVACEMVRRLFPAADTVVFDKQEDDDGDTQIDLVIIRDAAGRALWHADNGQIEDHPDAVALAEAEAYGGPVREQIESSTQYWIESHIRYAYDAADGHTFEPTDETFPAGGDDVSYYDGNLLTMFVDLPPADGTVPAVRVDRRSLTGWLYEQSSRDQISHLWEATPATVAALVNDLNNDPEPFAAIGWVMHPDLRQVDAWYTLDEERAARFAVRRLIGEWFYTDLIPAEFFATDLRGHYAARAALVKVAALLSEAYAKANTAG